MKEESTKSFDYHRKRFRKITAKHSKDKIQETISGLISQKWNELTKIDTKTLAKLTDFLSQFSEFDFSQINHSSSLLIPPNSTLVSSREIPGHRITKTTDTI